MLSSSSFTGRKVGFSFRCEENIEVMRVSLLLQKCFVHSVSSQQYLEDKLSITPGLKGRERDGKTQSRQRRARKRRLCWYVDHHMPYICASKSSYALPGSTRNDFKKARGYQEEEEGLCTRSRETRSRGNRLGIDLRLELGLSDNELDSGTD